MDEVELLINNYYGYVPNSNVDRLQVIGIILNFFYKEVSENSNNREYVDYMLKRTINILKIEIELRMKVIIDRYC